MSNTPLPEPVRILRHEGGVAMGLSLYLMTDFTQEVMSPQQADRVGWWRHDKHPSPLHAHAAAVSAERDAEIAGLRAEVAALTENGPPMQRGTTIEGTPWMGTMREVLEDYKSAADTEARWGDEARAEVAGLRSTLADSHAYAERLKQRIDEMMTERDVRIKVLEDALQMCVEQFQKPFQIHVPAGDLQTLDAARAALGDKTPTTQPPSPSPRS